WSRRSRRLARLLRILATVIREPGLHPARLAAQIGTSERTLYRDLEHLREIGFQVIYSEGYRLQEALLLSPDVHAGPHGLTEAYAELRRLVEKESAPTFAAQLDAEVATLAPAALAALFAEAVERRLALPNRSRRSRS
ncbi:MAG: HTH domain-containing protein, partial [Candidatus Dormiibacterota bacterium]